MERSPPERPDDGPVPAEDAAPDLPTLREGHDYVVEADGALVFTAAFLASRGACCRLGCRHCPYGPAGSG